MTSTPIDGPLQILSLDVEGMTCASCVNRIERYLNKVEGVTGASVNLATERARVTFDPSAVGMSDLVGAVERAGYNVRPQPAAPPADPTLAPSTAATPSSATQSDAHDAMREREIADLRRKSFVSIGVGLVMMAIMYLPLGLDMLLVAPLLLIAAAIVQFWAGAVFYRATWAAARHGATNMNTLVAVGTSVAFGYSAFVTLWPTLATELGFPYYLYYET
ncbi:MAG: cation transporter, partial [Chloroflexota bacterium]